MSNNQRSPHSMRFDDILDTDHDYANTESSISLIDEDINQNQDQIEYNNDAKSNDNMESQNIKDNAINDGMEMEAISISLSLCDSNEDQENDDNDDNEGRRTGDNYDDDKDMRLLMMEKVSDLMKRIQELTEKNRSLEVSKLTLIQNTANAMNQCRDTIKQLNRQNHILL